MATEVFWHLPGFCYFRFLNQITINMMKDYPECFRDGYKIGSVYGTFPGAIWNGGRAVFGRSSDEDIKKLLAVYNNAGVPVRFTWTNSLVTSEHVDDAYCNRIMELADNGMNQVLVNRPVLEDYLREKYPNFKYISSTTKRIRDLESFKTELDKDYFMVVLDYDLNHDEAVLKAIEPTANRVEILVDEICYPNCPKRTAHYADESKMQLENITGQVFDCPNKNTMRTFSECKNRPAFISNEEIGTYIDRGFINFKLVGRGLPMSMVEESYLYYLVKDEARDFIKAKIDEVIADIEAALGRKLC